MWAQLITMRLKPGMDNELVRLTEMLKAAEQPGSGLLRSTMMRDQNDPSQVYTLVVFENEEKARERENDSLRQAALKNVRALMVEFFDGPPEFVDLMVVADN